MGLEEKNLSGNQDQDKKSFGPEVGEVLSNSGLFKQIQAGDHSKVKYLTNIDKDTAMYLKKNFTGTLLDLSKVKEVSIDVAKVIKEISTFMLEIGVHENNDLGVFKELFQSRSDTLTFNGISDLPLRIARLSSIYEGYTLSFSKVTQLHDAAVSKELAKCRSDLEFKNIDFISSEAVEGFAGYKGKLCLDSNRKELDLDKEVLDNIKTMGLKVKLKHRGVIVVAF